MDGLFRIMLVVAIVSGCAGNPLAVRNDGSKCGTWTSFKEEKCINLAENAGVQTYKDATVVCGAFSVDFNKSLPRVLTVKTEEDQKFLEKFLFSDHNIVDNVWLGLRQKEDESEELEWSDGSKVVYTNFADDTEPDEEHGCVQMASGLDREPVGTWLWTSCRKRNKVICEVIPPTSLETLLSWFTNHKTELESLLEVSEEKINSLEEQLEQAIEAQGKNDELLNELTENGNGANKYFVPINFVYVQLPGQAPPSEIWPKAEWEDVSSQYDSLFFRVIGDNNSSDFDESLVQEASTVRLEQAESTTRHRENFELVTIPRDGNWSPYLKGGFSEGRHTRFRLSTDEIRPRNQAVQVWQRVEETGTDETATDETGTDETLEKENNKAANILGQESDRF